MSFKWKITSNLTQWANKGFLINNEIQEEVSWTKGCKVVLINNPDGGLKDLLRINNVFGLNITANE